MKTARQIALEALNRIFFDNAYSNLAVDSALKKNRLNDLDASFVSALVYGVLERQITIDYQLSLCLKQPLKRLKPALINILRLGVYQLLFADKVPESAAINESVKLTKNNGCAYASALTNAVLRQIQKAGLRLP